MTNIDLGYTEFTALRVDLGTNLDEGIARVTIDNGPVNLFDRVLYADMVRVGAQLAEDERVKVVVLQSANPNFFIAHFDVELILRIPLDLPEPTSLTTFHVMCETFRTMPKATIAKIEGRVGGGGSELSLSCDMRFASLTNAVFNQPEVALGIIPGGSGTQRLPRLINRSRALEVILGCDDIDAATAERWGWVNRALAPDQIGPFVDRLARRIAGFPAHAIAAAKASVLDHDGDLTEGLVREGARFQKTLSDPEAQTAMTNFMARGGQTVSGEQRLGDLATELRPTDFR
jgi:enoyl-CoA hydratase/carnithine racemase